VKLIGSVSSVSLLLFDTFHHDANCSLDYLPLTKSKSYELILFRDFKARYFALCFQHFSLKHYAYIPYSRCADYHPSLRVCNIEIETVCGRELDTKVSLVLGRGAMTCSTLSWRMLSGHRPG
jgi:hypothetical protein